MPGDEWSAQTSLAVKGQQEEDDDEAEVELQGPEFPDPNDSCLGPDDPGVGPWIFDFYD